MIIKGLQKTSLIDYPPYTISVIFVANCDFRCAFCQNPDLVNNAPNLKQYSQEEIIEFLSSRKKWLDGICITGGEPLLYPGIIDFIKKIKELNMKIKLDTNGNNSELLKKIIDDELVDYIAMDIKGPLNKYNEITKVNVNTEYIKSSIELIKNSNIEHEFRTTIIPDLNEEDIKKIGELLKGAKKFSIQQFRNTFKLLDESYNKQPYPEKKLKEFRKIMEGYVKKVEIK